MRVLIIDDDRGIRRSLTAVLKDEGYSVSTASDGREGMREAQRSDPAFILCDVRMPTMGGLEFLEAYRRNGGDALVIMITAYGTTEQAVDAMRRGAYDYLPKPLSADEVVLTLKKAEEREKLWREVSRLREQVRVEQRYDGIVARSAVMKSAVEEAERAARHDRPVLITGEAGTGKQRIGRMIHSTSARRRGRFVVADCGAMPPEILEAKLLGGRGDGSYRPNANGRGLLEEAHGGTLYLDEVEDLPVDLQYRLERVMEGGQLKREDGSLAHVDVRVVATTPGDLEESVAAGEFRGELLERLSALRIQISPLRERTDDIPPLVTQLLSRFNRELGLNVRDISAGAMQVLMEYPWPGNVEELESTLQRAMVFADGSEIGEVTMEQALREGT